MFSGRLIRAVQLSSRKMSSCINPNKLKGKVAVVTASTEGIGFAIAKRLAQDGAKVVISSRKQKNVDAALQNLKSENLDVTGLVCHVGKEDDRKKLMKKASEFNGGIDILVSNAASSTFMGDIFDMSVDQWQKIFDINVTASFFLCKEALPYMEKQGGGSIVLVTSIGGYQPFDLIGAYSVSKTALLGLVKAMAPSCGSRNIRVNALAPGVIKTKFSQAITENEYIAEETMKQLAIKRYGEPDEMAGMVSFMVSDDASYMTGETVIVAGGMPSRL